MDFNNKYTNMQKSFYNGGTSDHIEHNDNPDYWNILLYPISQQDNSEKMALDFGCGKGRNISNLQQYKYKRIDGVDISHYNIEYCKQRFPDYTFYENNGVDLQDVPSDTYDFVMSTIVLQHIPVYKIRYRLLEEIFRVMKTGAIFSLQMGYGDLEERHTHYHNNFLEAGGTNGACDVQIVIPQDLIKDIKNIGFKFTRMTITPSFLDDSHEYWLYILIEK